MTCSQCTALEQAVRDLTIAVEQLAAGAADSADQYVQGAKYWLAKA